MTPKDARDPEPDRMASIVESAKDAIIGYTPDGIIDIWNAGAERVFGYPAVQILGKSLATMLPVGAEDQWPMLLAACIGDGGAERYETTWQRLDGQAIAVDLSASTITDPEGRVLAGAAIVRDISKRRSTERALRQSEVRLAAILDQTSMGLAQTDFEGRFELVNPRFCQIVGRPARELYRMRVQDLIHPDDVGKNIQLVRALLVQHSHFEIEVRFVLPDGSAVWTSNSVTAMLDSDGRPQHMISAVLDTTQQKLAMQHVELMLDELNHRVKNTLATVQAIAQQTLARAPDLAAFRVAFEARLLALSKTHNLLAADAWTGARVADIVAGELEPFQREDHGRDRVRMSGADVVLSPKRALALSMAIHELATNASKYGALSAAQGRVDVHWAMELRGEERWLTLHWSESGGPEVAVPSHQGFGTRLITEGLAFELNGDAAIDYRPSGVSCVINVPLSEVDGDGS